MEVIWIVLGIAATWVGAAVTYNALKLTWFIVSWRVLGLKPMILDEKQVRLTAEECAQDYIHQWEVKRKKDGTEPDIDEAMMQFEVLMPYTAWAIARYTQNWSLGARPFWKKPKDLPEYEPQGPLGAEA